MQAKRISPAEWVEKNGITDVVLSSLTVNCNKRGCRGAPTHALIFDQSNGCRAFSLVCSEHVDTTIDALVDAGVRDRTEANRRCTTS